MPLSCRTSRRSRRFFRRSSRVMYWVVLYRSGTCVVDLPLSSIAFLRFFAGKRAKTICLNVSQQSPTPTPFTQPKVRITPSQPRATHPQPTNSLPRPAPTRPPPSDSQFPQPMHKLTSLEAQRVTSVLDSTLEKLQTLSYIPTEPDADTVDAVVGALQESGSNNVKR